MAPLTVAPALPPDSLIAISGVNGLIASHVADQFLSFGYRVRGTVRSPAKCSWMNTLFDKKYGADKFHLVQVSNMDQPDAFKAAMEGNANGSEAEREPAAAFIHTAANTSMNPDPNIVVPEAISGVIEAMRTAAKIPSVKRFVLTSSSAAALIPKPFTPGEVTVETFNEESVQYAYRDPPYEAERAYPVYAASKTLAEKEAWKFVKEGKDKEAGGQGFVFNAILPDMNTGLSLDPVNQGWPSTAGRIVDMIKGDITGMKQLPAQYFVDVQDCALLHVAAALHPDVKSERIFAFAEQINADEVLAILRRVYPDRMLPDNFQAEQDLHDYVARPRAEQLLKDMGKAEGWTSLEESVKRNTIGLELD